MSEDVTMRAQWIGDVLHRKPIADFVYQWLIQKYQASRESSDAGSITFALDAGWGVGKTFFISRWANDIEACEHPVVVFDAWRNDLTDEPLLGFIAALRDGLRAWTKNVPAGQAVKKSLMRSVEDLTKKAGRAAMPVASVLAQGAIKKITGTGIDQLYEILSNAQQEDETGGEVASQRTTNGLANDAIDKFFSISLDEHSKRIASIDTLKKAVRELLTQLESRAAANLPIFVFIDELDRCRPNYAIELLEGVKHLFDVPGVCFCVSTNLSQLSESIKGVYGSGFDARMYLKRFFTFEYRLPDPDNDSFAHLLSANSTLLKRKVIVSGLSDWGKTLEPSTVTIARSFAFVASSFQLSLRSQQQVFAISEAASSGIRDQHAVHTLFLFTLAALMHVNPEGFDDLISKKVEPTEFLSALDSRIPNSCKHSFTVLIDSHRNFHGEKQQRDIRLIGLLREYLRLAEKDTKEIREEFYNGNTQEYPGSLRRPLAEESPSSYNPNDQHPPSIRNYAHLVRTAGYIANP